MVELFEISIPAGSSSAAAGTAFAIPQGYRAVSMIVVGSAGISAGAVQLEGAHDKDYSGTWVAIGNPVTAVASSAVAVSSTNVFPALRARISTKIEDGTVTVYIFAVGN